MGLSGGDVTHPSTTRSRTGGNTPLCGPIVEYVPNSNSATARPTLAPRGAETWRLYASHGLGSFAVNGLGAVLLPLQTDLGVNYAAVALYPTVYSVATIAIGLTGGSLARKLGSTRIFILGLLCMMVGAALFAVPVRAATLVGVLVLGLGGSLTLQVIPARLSQLHGIRTGEALAESNASASFAAITSTLLVGAALGLGLTWRLGYILPIVAAAALIFLATIREQPDSDRPLPVPLTSHGETGSMWMPFVGILLAVGSEFALVFWAATTTEARFGVPQSVAVITTGVFISGIATGRILGRGIIRGMSPYGALMTGVCTAAVGFAGFFLAPVYPLAVAGLFVTGLGISILYPVLATRLLAAFPGNIERGSQFTVLGVGLSVGLSPLVLAIIAQWMDLRLAMLIVPAYLAALAILATVTRGRALPAAQP